MSNPKLNFKEETSAKKTRSPPEKAKVEQTQPKKKKLKLDTDKAKEKAQHLRFGKAELTPDDLRRLSKEQKREMYAAALARSAAHREIDQYEEDNVGVQALNEGEKAAGNVQDFSKNRYSRKLKKKAKMQAKKKARTTKSSTRQPDKAQNAGESGVFHGETSEGGSNWLSRWKQRQEIRKGYYAAARSGGTAAQTAGGKKAASSGASATRTGIHEIAFDVKKSLYNRLKHRLQRTGSISNRYIQEKYGRSREVRYLNGHAVVPIAYVQHRVPMDRKNRVNPYTPEGRTEIHKNLAGLNLAVMNHLMNTPAGQRSVEYNDNRIALYVAQKGKCAVSGIALDANQVDCHHKKPLSLGGDDSYQNLIIVSDAVHVLIHSSSERTIKKYLNDLQLNSKQLAKLNNLRKLAEMPQITL